MTVVMFLLMRFNVVCITIIRASSLLKISSCNVCLCIACHISGVLNHIQVYVIGIHLSIVQMFLGDK